MSPLQSMDRYKFDQFRETTLSRQRSCQILIGNSQVFRYHPHFPNIMRSRISQLMGVSQCASFDLHNSFLLTGHWTFIDRPLTVQPLKWLWNCTQPGWVQVWANAVDGWFRPRRCPGRCRSQESGEQDMRCSHSTIITPRLRIGVEQNFASWQK